MAKFNVTGEQYIQITRIVRDILRQVDAKNGSPLDPKRVIEKLRDANEPPMKLVRGNIFPRTNAFGKSFFTDGPVGFRIEKDFRRFILEEAPFDIPGGAYNLSEYRLNEEMRYCNMIGYLEGKSLFSITDFLAILKCLTEYHSIGQLGSYNLNYEYCNTFHIALDGDIVRALVIWNAEKGEWLLRALRSEDFDVLPAGHSVYSYN